LIVGPSSSGDINKFMIDYLNKNNKKLHKHTLAEIVLLISLRNTFWEKYRYTRIYTILNK